MGDHIVTFTREGNTVYGCIMTREARTVIFTLGELPRNLNMNLNFTVGIYIYTQSHFLLAAYACEMLWSCAWGIYMLLSTILSSTLVLTTLIL
ncbi:hypothetical protein JB92DRAFT_2870937 [Gautieria morchelliformis]|nr:hypothetical protein JB92DRAFT_2870937 [Gautieria morchelliformis]